MFLHAGSHWNLAEWDEASIMKRIPSVIDSVFQTKSNMVLIVHPGIVFLCSAVSLIQQYVSVSHVQV